MKIHNIKYNIELAVDGVAAGTDVTVCCGDDCITVPVGSGGGITVPGGSFSEGGDLTCSPGSFVGGRVFVSPGRFRRGAAERAELEAARAELEQVRGDLEATASELEAARAELAVREPVAIIDGAMQSGRAAVEFALANFEYDAYWGYGYHRWEKGDIEKNLEISKPWVSPSFALPSPDDEGHPPSLATFFGGSSKLLYSAPIALGECTNLHQAWQSCPMLREAPSIDTSKVRNFAGCFYGSTLKDFPDWDYSSATRISGFFQTNKVIEETSAIHLPQATDLKQMLWACPKLRRLGAIYAPKAKDIRITNISDDSSLGLERIDEIDYGSATTNAILHYLYMATKLRYARFINIGKSAFTNYQLGFPNWGDGSDENRQSLIDSLITCSHDRTAAGMPVATLALHPHTIARLTEEEIAEITAKGFTITEATKDRVDN